MIDIVFLIDIQNGFAKDGLTPREGGSLYVPGGENIGGPAANLIRSLSGTTVVLSQDFHPADHISFASNHPGVAPFSNINLKRSDDGSYDVSEDPSDGAIRQTIWPDHCIQGTESALFVDAIMDELPKDLNSRLRSHAPGAVLMDADGRDNKFYVVRKGTKSDLDSYGIATENDGVSTTAAPIIFASIADTLHEAGVEDANIYIGGLATNFCVEFSHRDIYRYLVPDLKALGIEAKVHLLTDISIGIPVIAPDGVWPDLASAPNRMTALGTMETTTNDIIRRGSHEGASVATS